MVDYGGEPVTVRGTPSKQSEQDSARALLDRNIDVLVLGIYSLKSETAFIVDDAKKRGIKTVGFAVPVKESPFVTEDTYLTGMTLTYFAHNYCQRQGTFVQTAESKGFYTPFDQEADQFDLMTKYEPRMKVLPFMSGSVSTQDQISKGRENVLSLCRPIRNLARSPASFPGGGRDHRRRSGATADESHRREDLQPLFLGPAPAGNGGGHLPHRLLHRRPLASDGQKGWRNGHGHGSRRRYQALDVAVPVTAILPEQAKESLAEVQDMDKQAIAFLKQYGG